MRQVRLAPVLVASTVLLLVLAFQNCGPAFLSQKTSDASVKSAGNGADTQVARYIAVDQFIVSLCAVMSNCVGGVDPNLCQQALYIQKNLPLKFAVSGYATLAELRQAEWDVAVKVDLTPALNCSASFHKQSCSLFAGETRATIQAQNYSQADRLIVDSACSNVFSK